VGSEDERDIHTTPRGEPVFRVENVTKRFGEVVAVDRANFEVGQNEFFSLLGPSGCGKTTTLRILAGFEQPSEGRVMLQGRDASNLPPYRRDTNMVFQNYALFPHMTISENVAFGPKRRRLGDKEVRERVGQALETVRMRDLAMRYPRELSGGQQQRVALARALANRPAVLLLDEPLGALDLKLREEMQFELKRIQQDVGIAFVYVTHDQGEALTMSDRIAVMNNGRVEQIGTPEEIYVRPASIFVANFIGQANLVPCIIKDIVGPAIQVTLPGGSVGRAGAAAEGCVPGQEGVIVLRPEHLRIGLQKAQQADSEIPVTVVSELFQGPVIRYRVNGPDGVTLSVIVGLDARLRSDVVGRAAYVSWNPIHAYVLPGAGAFPLDAAPRRAE
jgi:spermidine/putrescine transport system ATP-binding protein